MKIGWVEVENILDGHGRKLNLKALPEVSGNCRPFYLSNILLALPLNFEEEEVIYQAIFLIIMNLNFIVTFYGESLLKSKQTLYKICCFYFSFVFFNSSRVKI